VPIPGSYGWLDSTVALQWLKGGREYKQFVANRVRKIQAFPDIKWPHVHSADLGSRGGQVIGNLLHMVERTSVVDYSEQVAKIYRVASKNR
jgi:hypothetical protein